MLAHLSFHSGRRQTCTNCLVTVTNAGQIAVAKQRSVVEADGAGLEDDIEGAQHEADDQREADRNHLRAYSTL